VLIYPAPVQGAASVAALVAALTTAGVRAECQVLILARGGGSLEDLWAFNDERLARAIRACPLPVISAVGHELDFTIADFVADARAPTPSAAAELVVADRAAVLEAVRRTAERLAVSMRRELRAIVTRLEGAQRRLARSHPGARLQQQAQRLDELALRLKGATRASAQRDRLRLAELQRRLMHRSPDRLLEQQRSRHQDLRLRLGHAVTGRTAAAAQRLALAQRALNAVSPLATLARGFAIVTRADGGLVTDAATVLPGEEVEARLARGTLTARVSGRREER
jgi:exodeoxyribonuclease VII large subunit